MKKAGFLLLFLVLVLLAGTAGAAGRTNPDRQAAVEAERLAQELLALQKSGGSVQANDNLYGLQITCTRQPALNGTGSWNIALKGHSASQVKRMICYLGYKDWSSNYTHVHWICKDRDNGDANPFMSSYTTPKIVTAGSYEIMFYVTYWDNTAAWYVRDFTISGTNALQNKINSVAASCKVSDDWQTALNLHEWLVTHMYYDLSLEFYGADSILRGYGVCDSYSKIYLMLCKAAEIPVCRVTNDSHAWNAVKLDRAWYYVDCTWDDPSGVKKLVSGSEKHTYYCLNDYQLGVDHPLPWDWAGTSRQTCSALDANYFVHTGEWKKWGDYGWDYNTGNYTVNTLSEQIQHSFDNGITTYVIDWNSRKDGNNIWLWNMKNGDLKAVLITDREKAIIHYALPRTPFILENESVKVRIEKAAEQIAVKIAGWNIVETGTLKTPINLRIIQDETFRGNAATTLEIRPGCEEIESGAFRNSGIRTVSVPTSVTRIANDAFAGCGRLIFRTTNSEAVRYAQEHGDIVVDP